MSEQKQVSDNLLMTTWLNAHDCTFTWRVRNLSLLASTKAGVQQVFTLHPECDKKWKLRAESHFSSFSLELVPVVPERTYLASESYIGVYLNPKGEFDKAETFSRVSIEYVLTSKEGELTTWCGKVVEMEDDTLVVMGRVVVPSCCPKTEIDKEEPKATEPLDLCKLMEDELNVA